MKRAIWIGAVSIGVAVAAATAAALSTSPAFLDRYVAAARYAARLAVGESARSPAPTIPSPWRAISRPTSTGSRSRTRMAGGVHSLAPATWLSGMRPDRRSAGASMSATLDQVVAQRIGQDTTLPSLELASETTPQAAACPLANLHQWSREIHHDQDAHWSAGRLRG